jgi:MFS transporter, DHA1 family, tetracycline resistance protein
MRFHHRAVPIVLTILLIDSIGFGIVLPVLPGLIVHLGKVSLPEATRIAGYMLVVYAVAQFFAGPVIGNLGDRFGRRPVLLFATIAFALDYLFMAAAPTLAWLFVGRAIAGIAGATYGPANAVLADITPPEKRGATFGLMGAAFGLGFILGPAIGGLTASLGTRTPFIIAAVLATMNALWIALALPETLPEERRRPFRWRDAHIFGAFRPLFHAGGATALLVAAFLWQLAHIVYPSTWAFWGELAMHWDAAMIGWSLAAAGLAMALAQTFVTGRAIARFGEARTVVIGMVVGGLAFLGYVFARSDWLVFTIIFLSALQGLVWPSMNALLSRMTDASHQGALQGGMASIASISAIIGPLAMTQALAFGAERGEPGGAFLLAAVLVVCGLVIVVLGVVRKLAPDLEPHERPVT